MFKKEKAIIEAKRLLEKYDITEPIVNVLKIAESEGLEISFVTMPEEYSNVSGFLNKEEKTIVVNKNDSVTRKSFTIAHELGHYILDHKPGEYGLLYRKSMGEYEKIPKEMEANCFAANLLVPEDMLKDVMKKMSLGRNDSWIIAKIFGVSEQMMEYRLKSARFNPLCLF